jgi:hypothetical protein
MSVRFEIDSYNSIDTLILWHNTRQSVRSHIRRLKTEDVNGYTKSSGSPKYGKAASERVKSAMRRSKKGTV